MNVEQLQQDISIQEERIASYKSWIEKVSEIEEKILNGEPSGLETTHIKLSDQKKLHIPTSSDLSRKVGALESKLEEELGERPEIARPIEEPERQTGAEVREEVEAANPGYIMIQGQMHNIETLKERAVREGISLRTLVNRMGGDLGDRSRY